MGFEYSALRVNTLRGNLEEELALVENYIRFLDGRKTGGLLFIPDGLTSPEEDGHYAESDEESFEDVLLKYMIEAVQDPDSAASIVPIIIRGPEEYRDQIRHIDLDNEFYATLAARAYKLKAQIAELDKQEK